VYPIAIGYKNIYISKNKIAMKYNFKAKEYIKSHNQSIINEHAFLAVQTSD